MKILAVLGTLALLFSLPAGAQTVGTTSTIGGPSINAAASLSAHGSLAPPAFYSLPSSAPVQFRVTTVSGSNDFVPSLFLTYGQALASGSALHVRYVYVPYDEAVAKGKADLAARPKSLAQVARELRSETGSKSTAIFVQDDKGRIVKQSD
jgi:hypothetical protein